MSGTEEVSGRIERYLAQLDRALDGIAAPERQDIVREIRCHIAERVEGAGERTGEALDETLWALGAPGVLAARYRKEAQLERASRSRSPWVLARTALRWARNGVGGFTAFVVAITGYSISGSFLLAGLLKLIVPARIGLWVDSASVNLGWRSIDAPPADELLGPWLPPVCFGLGVLALVGTTRLLRLIIRRLLVRKRAAEGWRAERGLSAAGF